MTVTVRRDSELIMYDDPQRYTLLGEYGFATVRPIEGDSPDLQPFQKYVLVKEGRPEDEAVILLGKALIYDQAYITQKVLRYTHLSEIEAEALEYIGWLDAAKREQIQIRIDNMQAEMDAIVKQARDEGWLEALPS